MHKKKVVQISLKLFSIKIDVNFNFISSHRFMRSSHVSDACNVVPFLVKSLFFSFIYLFGTEKTGP